MANDALLITFGTLVWMDRHDRSHRVSAIDVFDDLATKRGVWYSSRLMNVPPGTPALFYLKHVGMIAHATVEEASPIDNTDAQLLERYGIAYFKTKMRVVDLVHLNPPIDLRPLIPRLSFIKNKGAHWGTALRTSPRYIPKADFSLITSQPFVS